MRLRPLRNNPALTNNPPPPPPPQDGPHDDQDPHPEVKSMSISEEDSEESYPHPEQLRDEKSDEEPSTYRRTDLSTINRFKSFQD